MCSLAHESMVQNPKRTMTMERSSLSPTVFELYIAKFLRPICHRFTVLNDVSP